MEDILSSIKRIIAEDGDAQAARPRRVPRAAAAPTSFPMADEGDDEPEILELNDPAPALQAAPVAVPAMEPAPVPAPATTPRAAVAEPSVAATPAGDSGVADTIVSRDAAAASRGSLDALTRMIARPEPVAAGAGVDKSMEAFVGELLRPLLREWLDAHLPEMVEAMVAKEIARITGGR